MSKHIYVKAKKKIVFIYEFLHSESLFIFAENFFKLNPEICINSYLFKFENKYRICVFTDKSRKSELISMVEFADQTYNEYHHLSSTLEYGKEISKGNPLMKLYCALK